MYWIAHTLANAHTCVVGVVERVEGIVRSWEGSRWNGADGTGQRPDGDRKAVLMPFIMHKLISLSDHWLPIVCRSVSLCLSVCLSHSICLPICLTLSVSLCLFVCLTLSACHSMSVCLSICQSVTLCLSAYLSLSLSAKHDIVCLFQCKPFCGGKTAEKQQN